MTLALPENLIENLLERLGLAKKHERLPEIILQAILLTKSLETYQLRK